MKYDIVYILQNGYEKDELIYSLRSICANFPHRKVWIYGGTPEGLDNVSLVPYTQVGNTKWERVNNTIKEICKNDEITEDFWLFNDDFFIMKKVRKLEPMTDGTLWARVNRIADRHGNRDTEYSARLRDTARVLRDRGYDRLNYALHVPMLINRKKGLETLNEFKGYPMFRSLYGNHHRIGGVIGDDVKIMKLSQKPTGKETYLSTDDKSFAEGEAGRYIRKAFPEKCKYEQA